MMVMRGPAIMMPMILAIRVPAGMAISMMLLESSIGLVRNPVGEVIVVGGGMMAGIVCR